MTEHGSLGAFGDWLAGFIDGEGSFVIYSNADSRWKCRLGIWLRADDTEILHEIQRRTCIGTINAVPPRPGRSQQMMWQVQSRADCLRLIEILDAHPLRAKKARDYAIWRQAVFAWARVVRGSSAVLPANAPCWEQMGQLRNELNDGRVFRAA